MVATQTGGPLARKLSELPVAGPRLPDRLGRVWRAALVVVPAAVLLVDGYWRRFMSDDGLIYTRVIRQILAGNGPVFNATERAEASTSTVWPWLVAFGSWVTRVEPDRLAVFGGLAMTVVGLGLAVDATCRLHGDEGRSRALVPAGVIVLLGVPPVRDFASSGLETGLGTLWLAACWWLLVRARRAPLPAPGAARAPLPAQGTARAPAAAGGLSARGTVLVAVVFGLGPLIRPDLAIVSGCFLVALLLLVRPRWPAGLLLMAAAGALPLAYEIFRAGYYGVLLPLPGLAKEGTRFYWPRGLHYLGDFLSPYWLWWPLAGVAVLLALVGLRRRVGQDSVVVLTPVVAGLLLGIYVVAVGGDFMHGRMLLPPLMMLLLPVLVVPATKVSLLTVVAIAVWALVGMTPLRPPFNGGPGVQYIRGVDIAMTRTANPVTAQQWIDGFGAFPEQVESGLAAGRPTLLYGDTSNMLQADARPDTGSRLVVYGGWLGVTGAVVPLNQTIADEWSLAYPLGAHFEMTERATFPGHEKPVPWVWFFADYADPAVTAPPGADPAAVAAARRALGCGALRELQESVRAPMTFSRFWKNLVGSVSRTRLRIPMDPYVAEARFCTTP